jgi:hypothetical protein
MLLHIFPHVSAEEKKFNNIDTRVMRRTLNPVYDEDFTFYGIHFNQLPVRPFPVLSCKLSLLFKNFWSFDIFIFSSLSAGSNYYWLLLIYVDFYWFLQITSGLCYYWIY